MKETASVDLIEPEDWGMGGVEFTDVKDVCPECKL